MNAPTLPPRTLQLIEQAVRAAEPGPFRLVSIKEIRSASSPAEWTWDALRGWSVMGRMILHQTHKVR
jgi:hypothetical protein